MVPLAASNKIPTAYSVRRGRRPGKLRSKLYECDSSSVMVLSVALRLSCVTYCHIRIKLAATSTDEPAFLATLIELSVWSRQFRLSNEPKIVSGTKRLLDA